MISLKGNKFKNEKVVCIIKGENNTLKINYGYSEAFVATYGSEEKRQSVLDDCYVRLTKKDFPLYTEHGVFNLKYVSAIHKVGENTFRINWGYDRDSHTDFSYQTEEEFETKYNEYCNALKEFTQSRFFRFY